MGDGNRAVWAGRRILGVRSVNMAKMIVKSEQPQVNVGEDRRRSQRVLLRVPAMVHLNLAGKPVSIAVSTVSVNSHGALLIVPQNIPESARLVLEHGKTGERAACHVSRPSREMPEGFHIPVEFDPPAPGFWQIDFPPQDWRPPEGL